MAGLDSAPTPQGRADLVLAELKRTGAYEREVLVLATTTGSGFIQPEGIGPLEYLWHGDTAVAGIQYSYLPSWLSLLADQDPCHQKPQHDRAGSALEFGDPEVVLECLLPAPSRSSA